VQYTIHDRSSTKFGCPMLNLDANTVKNHAGVGEVILTNTIIIEPKMIGDSLGTDIMLNL